MKKIKQFFDEINLSKRYPGYFNKWLIRGALIILILFQAYLYYDNGGMTSAYFECAEDSFTQCKNIFYGSTHKDCDRFPNLCSQEFLIPGEMVGRKPSSLFESFEMIVFLVLGGTFLLNHILWRLKSD